MKDPDYYVNKKRYAMIVLDHKGRPVAAYNFPNKREMMEARPVVAHVLQDEGFHAGTAAYCIEFNGKEVKLLASAFIKNKVAEA